MTESALPGMGAMLRNMQDPERWRRLRNGGRQSWATDPRWQTLSPTERAAAMALMEADNRGGSIDMQKKEQPTTADRTLAYKAEPKAETTPVNGEFVRV